MASLLVIQFPDDSWEYHVPFKRLDPGDVIRARGHEWTVAAVEQDGDAYTVSVTRDPAGGGQWPGPVDDVDLYAPAA